MLKHSRPLHLKLATLILLCIPVQQAMASELTTAEKRLYVGHFSSGTTSGWEQRSFDGETIYKLVENPTSGVSSNVLQASSNRAASGLFREMRIDLKRTPWLHWSWRTEQIFSNINENEKSGDDFVARIYIVIDGGILFWNTRALNYVWSSSHQRGETWPNPFTANATMIAVESGPENIGKWRSYRRNIREDLQRIIGRDVDHIDAIAIMTDSDSAGQKATTYFGDIFFTSE